MGSIRSTLLLGTITGSASVLFAVMAVISWLLRALVVEHFDGALHETAQSIQLSFEQIPRGLSLELEELDVREFNRKDRPAYFQAWLDDGRSIYRSPSLDGRDLPRFSGRTDVPEFRWLELPDGRPGRSIGLASFPRRESGPKKGRVDESSPAAPVEPRKPAAHRVTVVVARETASIHGPWKRISGHVAVVGCSALALSTGVLSLIIRRSLRPLDRIAGKIAGLDPDDLSARVMMDSTPPLEIQPIVHRLNGLLGKLEAAFERERALTADVAHELRTPIAGIRMTTDVALSRPRSPEQYREALGECRTIAVEMQDTIENLLSLARIEAGLARIEACPVSVKDSLQSVWKLLEPSAAARGLRVEWSLDGDVPITTDPTLLGIVLRNLLQNAVEYADEGGSIGIAASSAGGRLELEVRNTGCRLSPEQAERVFDRFWRGDAARSSAGVHCGMGLALVKSIASLLGGTARASSSAGGEFVVDVSISDRAGSSPPAQASRLPEKSGQHLHRVRTAFDGSSSTSVTPSSAPTHQEDT
jgi:signal transduction histidine kinase